MADIHINHTRTEGTILTGSRKGDGVYEIVRDHTFRFSREVGLYIRGSRDKESSWRINAAAAALREAGHTVTVEIDDEDPRTFAEREAEQEQRAADRADRADDHAGRAAASADARRAKADQISERFWGGQPILVGHHSEGRARRDQERIHTNMRRSFEDRDRADYWANKARAAEHYADYRKDPHRTLRRLERLRADLRALQRQQTETTERGWEPSERTVRRVRELAEQIAGWEQLVEEAKAEGVKVWGPEDFAPGDFVLYLRSWYEVHRVNPKTLSVAWNLRLAPKQVMTVEDATFELGRVGTHPADYTKVAARCPGDAMRAFLADGKVPGTRSAGEASEVTPAADVRAAQAEAKKKAPKRRISPKVPRGVRLRCGWNATEAELTFLNGRNQPHKDHPAVTLTAPEGEKYADSVWSKTLGAQVTEALAAAGYAYAGGGWNGGPGYGLVASIAPLTAEASSEEPVAPQAEEQPVPEPAADEQPTEETTPAEEPAIEEEAPVKVWSRADFKRGDWVQVDGRWHKVVRSNPRSVSIDVSPWLIQWDMVTGRRGAAEMAAAEDQAPVDEPSAPVDEDTAGGEKTASDQGFLSDHPVPQAGTGVSHSVQPLQQQPASEGAHTMTTEATATETPQAAPAKKAVRKTPAKAPAKKAAAPTKAVEAKAKPDTQKVIPIDRIDRDPGQPREHFDEEKLAELAGSMRALGQLQPISVRYDTGTRRYTIIMGERRWRAAQMAGLTEMTAVVQHNAVAGSRELLARQVAENVGRADMTAMEEAKSFKALETSGYEVEEIGRMCGKSPAYVGWRIDLLKLHSSAQEALAKGHLGLNLAWYAAQLSQANQVRFLSKYSQGAFASDRDAEAFVKACRAEEQQREAQGSFFVLADETEAKKGDTQEALYGPSEASNEERERVASERVALTKKIERLSTAGEILAELATADPEELALLLAGAAGGVAVHTKRMEHLRKLTGQAISNLTKAQAIASVRAGGIEINPDAVAEADAA